MVELVRAKAAFPGRTGYPRSSGYKCVRLGLLPPPISIGPRAKAFVGAELDAVAAARIRGASDDEVRALVRELVAARKAPVAGELVEARTRTAASEPVATRIEPVAPRIAKPRVALE